MDYETFVDVVQSRIASPGATCFFADDNPVSWGDVGRHLNGVGAALAARGLAGAARVALRMDDPSDFFRSLLAVIGIGGAAVPIPARLRPAAAAAILRDSGAAAVITGDRESKSLADAVPPQTAIIPLSDVAEHAKDAPQTAPPVRANPDCEMVVLYSSGTTAEPKGVIHTHRTRRHAALRAIRHYRLAADERTLINAPVYTARGIAPFLATAFAGGVSIVQSEFDVPRMSELVVRFAPTTIDMVPTQFSLLLDHPKFDPAPYSACRFILCGGAALDPALRERLFDVFPGYFIQGYGSTETDFVFRMPRQAPYGKHGSVGTARDVAIVILNEQDEPLPAGTAGEIALSSPSNFVGYAGGVPAADDVFWTDPGTGQRYYRTGDLGSLDADGYLWLTGRKKDMIITAGFNIYPADLEQIVVQHPAVREAAVVGFSHAVLGETPLAFVVLRESGREPSTARAEICRWANARLNANQRLYDVRLVDELPRNPSGKVLKSRLKELAAASTAA